MMYFINISTRFLYPNTKLIHTPQFNYLFTTYLHHVVYWFQNSLIRDDAAGCHLPLITTSKLDGVCPLRNGVTN